MIEKVFISYSSVDKKDACFIADALGHLGVSFFQDEKAIKLGDDITASVESEMKSATSVIFVVSPASIKSRWVFFEIGQAKALEKAIVIYLTHPSLEQDLPDMVRGVKYALSVNDIQDYYLKRVFGAAHESINTKCDCEREVRDDKFIVSVGGANSEYTIKLLGVFQRGQKHQSELSKRLFGGSGLNMTLRLLNMSIPVLPVLTVGNDVEGQSIQQSILSAVPSGGRSDEVKNFIGKDDFFVSKAATPRSTIIVDSEDRHIIKENETGIQEFTGYLEKKLNSIAEKYEGRISAITIGHIRSDSNVFYPKSPGKSTKYIINKFAGQVLVFANLGSSQISEGFEYWKDDIRKIDILQLHIDEAKIFFSEGGKVPTLSEIIGQLIDLNITAIVTLDEFGAIATCKDAGRYIIIAYPFEMDNIVDPTGAGDAFGAGMMSCLSRFEKISFSDLYNAISEARFWAAYACKHLGGSSQCPNRDQLEAFKGELSNNNHEYSLEVMSLKEAEWQMRIIEKAFIRRRKNDI